MDPVREHGISSRSPVSSRECLGRDSQGIVDYIPQVRRGQPLHDLRTQNSHATVSLKTEKITVNELKDQGEQKGWKAAAQQRVILQHDESRVPVM
jgi:hypothetical protein